MGRLIDALLRGRAQPSSRHEAAAAVGDIRAFVHAWRPAAGAAQDASGSAERTLPGKEPTAEDLFRLAQVFLFYRGLLDLIESVTQKVAHFWV